MTAALKKMTPKNLDKLITSVAHELARIQRLRSSFSVDAPASLSSHLDTANRAGVRNALDEWESSLRSQSAEIIQEWAARKGLSPGARIHLKRGYDSYSGIFKTLSLTAIGLTVLVAHPKEEVYSLQPFCKYGWIIEI